MRSDRSRRPPSSLVALVVALASPAAQAAPGASVALSVASAEVRVVLTGSPPSVSAGALPLGVPFHQGNPSCSGDGSVSVAVLQGTLQVDAAGTVAGSGCTVEIEVGDAILELRVPNLESPMTPVFLSGVVARQSGEAAGLDAAVDGIYTSAAIGISVLAFEERSHGAFPFLRLRHPATGDRQSRLMWLVSGDAIALEAPSGARLLRASFAGSPAGSSFSGTYRVEAFLPPTGYVSGSPVAPGPVAAAR